MERAPSEQEGERHQVAAAMDLALVRDPRLPILLSHHPLVHFLDPIKPLQMSTWSLAVTCLHAIR